MCVSDFPLHRNLLTRSQMDSRISKEVFEKKKSACKAYVGQYEEGLSNLSIPNLTEGRRTGKKEMWKRVSYEEFAVQLERNNPEAVFTKHMVDGAFRLAVSRSSDEVSSMIGREKSIARVS